MFKQVAPVFSRIINQSKFFPKCNLSGFGSKGDGKIYEPPYLELMKPEFPAYDVINVRLTGYDFPVLESYQRFVHRIASALDLDVSENWAHPPKKENVVTYKPNSAIAEHEYQLTTYDRYVQINDIEAKTYSVFLRFIQSGLPEGVTLSVVHHTEFLEESRYVPDKDLLDLKQQLEDAGGASRPSRKTKS